MRFDIEKFYVTGHMHFKTRSWGTLQPIFDEVKFNFGKTRIYHETWWISLLLDSSIEYVLVICQNALYVFGTLILNDMVEAPMTRILDFYQLNLDLPPLFKGQNESDTFRIDFRNVPGKDPFMGTGALDLMLNGEWFYGGKACDKLEDDHIHFYDSQDYS